MSARNEPWHARCAEVGVGQERRDRRGKALLATPRPARRGARRAARRPPPGRPPGRGLPPGPSVRRRSARLERAHPERRRRGERQRTVVQSRPRDPVQAADRDDDELVGRVQRERLHEHPAQARDPQVRARARGGRRRRAVRVGESPQGEKQRAQLGAHVLLVRRARRHVRRAVRRRRPPAGRRTSELDQDAPGEGLTDPPQGGHRSRAGPPDRDGHQPRRRAVERRRASRREGSRPRRCARLARRGRAARLVPRSEPAEVVVEHRQAGQERGGPRPLHPGEDARGRAALQRHAQPDLPRRRLWRRSAIGTSDGGSLVSSAAARVRSIQASVLAGDPSASTTPRPISPSSAPWPDARARSSIVGRLDRWTARSRRPARHSASAPAGCRGPLGQRPGQPAPQPHEDLPVAARAPARGRAGDRRAAAGRPVRGHPSRDEVRLDRAVQVPARSSRPAARRATASSAAPGCRPAAAPRHR